MLYLSLHPPLLKPQIRSSRFRKKTNSSIDDVARVAKIESNLLPEEIVCKIALRENDPWRRLNYFTKLKKKKKSFWLRRRILKEAKLFTKSEVAPPTKFLLLSP